MLIKTHIKETLKLALPISFGQLGHIMMGVVDSMMIGKVGAIPLAAASLVNGLFFLVLVIGFGTAMAASPLISMAKGAKNYQECGKTLKHSVIFNMLFSIILVVAVFFVSYLIPFMNQPKEVVAEAVPYMQVLAFSAIGFMGFQSYRQFLEGLSFPIPPMVIAVAANFSNAFLNWILIYGKFGFPAMGLFGAGIATTISRIIMALVLMLYVHKAKHLKEFNPQVNVRDIDFGLIKKLLRIGLPSGFQYFLEVAAFSFAAIMIGWIGSIQLASHQIAINLASVTYMIILGIASAGTIRVGGFMGQHNLTEVRKAGFSALGITIAIMASFALMFVLFRNQLVHLYINDPQVVDMALQLILIAAMFQIFDGMQATSIGILRGLQDVKIPLIISIASYWVIGIPVGWLLSFYFNLGALGVWIGLLLSLVTLGIPMALRFNYKTK